MSRWSRRATLAVVRKEVIRVPTEMLFGQGFNDLFVVRVAGNVLGEPGHEEVRLAAGSRVVGATRSGTKIRR